MAKFLLVILPIFLAQIAPAAADFTVVSGLSDGGGPKSEFSGTPNTSATVPTVRSDLTIHWKMAAGFGTNVPLAFACRQIVPPAVKVTYGNGVDPTILVSWKGGGAWNRVLRATVKPLGLHLRMAYMAVEIEK